MTVTPDTRRIPSLRPLITALIAVMTFSLLPSRPARADTTVLIPLAATWKYLDDGSDPGASWTQPPPGFDDTLWLSGPAELGYGDGDEATTLDCGCGACPGCSPKNITTYFRHTFTLPVGIQIARANLRMVRDDGAVVYLNGTEVFRTNMPGGVIGPDTLASIAVGGSGETGLQTGSVGPPSLFVAGDNTVAVEIHQANATSSDISFDLELTADSLVRGPYLQNGTTDSAIVAFRTVFASVGRVWYGTDPNALSSFVDGPSGVDHAILITGLNADTTYFYAVGTPTVVLDGADPDQFFKTAPVPGTAQPTRLWVIGDSGGANGAARLVRDDFLSFAGATKADVWLMLGDNAYQSGTDIEYQAAVFETYPTILRNTFVWPTFGNHDALSSSSATQTGPYFDIFELPTGSGAGGMPSGTEAYYSFDWANVHFLVLDSQGSHPLTDPNHPMLVWARADLASTTQDWIIAYWHHPPYTKGSHDSDLPLDSGGRMVNMRALALPDLEDAGVDLVLAGHSHVYERSMLIDGHYGDSSGFNTGHQVDAGDGCVCVGDCAECPGEGLGPYVKSAPTLGHEGTVYAVVGSSSRKANVYGLAHPVMVIGLDEYGSMVIDVDGPRLDATWIQQFGVVRDRVTLLKGGDVDGDGVGDSDDNCIFEPNPVQADDGQLGGPGVDGTGNACQCGELTGEGEVTMGDVALLRSHLADPAAGLLGASELARCTVIGSVGSCDITEVVVLTRALSTLPPAQLPPDPLPRCSAAVE